MTEPKITKRKNMKIRLVLIMSLLVSCVMGQNLLQNPGFEDDTAWRVWGTWGGFSAEDSKVLKSYDTEVFKTGSRSLRTTDDQTTHAAYIVQFLENLSDKDSYMLTFWAKSDKEQTARVGMIMSAFIDGVEKYKGASIETISLTQEWKKYSVAIKSIVAGSTKFGVILAATNSDKASTGTVWYDDVSLTKVTEADIMNLELAGLGEPKEDGLTFYADFENGADANFAISEVKPIEEKGLKFVEGKFGKGVEIKGDAKLTYNGKSMLLEEGTLCMWVKRYEPWSVRKAYTLYILKGSGPWNSSAIYGGVTSWNQLRMWIWSEDQKNFTVRTPNGIHYKQDEWYHMAFAYRDGDVKIYVNGEETSYGIASDPNCEMPLGLASTLAVGSTYTPDAVFNGVFDEIRFYNERKRPEEIKKIYEMVPEKSGEERR